MTDDWIDHAPDNALRAWAALAAFGAPLADLGVTPGDLGTPGVVVQIGLPPARIDVLTAISGVPTFAEAWPDRLERDVRGVRVPFLGRNALLRNKRAAGRRQDLADIEALGEDPEPA
ncbi:MAG: hypothetical protein NW201_13305 [Gemmatimonadales bacterium]|nr:hypothetical protein [Gemmatimonadales bacterium]